MQIQTTRRMTAGVFLALVLSMPALAGCGSHDATNPSGGSGTMTTAQIQQNTQKQNEYLKNHPTTANAAPAAPATH